MPGPFPGMDPYLETPPHWHSLHNTLILEIARALNADLPEGFAANVEERVYVTPPRRVIYPDALVLRPSLGGTGGGSAAVAEPEAPQGIVIAEPERQKELYAEVVTAKDNEPVVIVIEILSPANKAPGGAGREEYHSKQAALLYSGAHFLEIDLLREGAHTLAAPIEEERTRAQRDYLFSLHRINNRHRFEYWTRAVRERLPVLPVPLTPGVADVPLDLQAAFDRAYDAGPYRRRVDYSAPPDMPLRPEDAAWADALLRDRGLRPAAPGGG